PDGVAPRPFPARAGRGGVRDAVLPEPVGVLVLDVIVAVALPRVPEAAVEHVVGLLVIAEVLRGIQPAAGVEGAHGEPRLAQRIDGHAPAGARADDDDVVALVRHGSASGLRRGEVTMLRIAGVRAARR